MQNTSRNIIITVIALAALSTIAWFVLNKQNKSTIPEPNTIPNPVVATNATTTYTMAQIAAHKDAASCYTTIRGSVYDLTSWISRHPGGPGKILALCGTDGTQAFVNQHGGSTRPENELATFKIGVLTQ